MQKDPAEVAARRRAFLERAGQKARALVVLVGTVVVVAGCVAGSGSAAPSGSSSVVGVAASSSSQSLAPTPPAPGSSQSPLPPLAASPTVVAGSPTASPTLPHADANLERYLPTQTGTVALYRWSLTGPDVPPTGGDMCLFLCGNEPREFANALGIPLDQVTVALAMGEQGGIGGVAFRAKGVATKRLAAAGASISGGVVGGGPSFPMMVAGRNVTYLQRLGRGQYLIPIGDVLVFLYGEAPMTAPGHISPNGTVPPDVVALIDALPR